MDQTKGQIVQTRDNIQVMIEEMQSKLTLSHATLNSMFKEQVTRQNKIERLADQMNDRLASVENTNQMLEERSTSHSKTIERLRVLADNLKETKQDKSNWMEQKLQIQGQFDEINKDIDILLNKTKTMEHFIDKYIPIRIQKLISETAAAISSPSQLTRLQNFEMEKFKRLNEDLLNDEQHPELIDLMRALANDLDETIQKFKAIAKAKGVRYKVATKMKDAILNKILKPAIDAS